MSEHDGVRESKGSGRVTSMYSWGDAADLRRCRRCVVKWELWSDGGSEAAESGNSKVRARRRREGCIMFVAVEELIVMRERRGILLTCFIYFLIYLK